MRKIVVIAIITLIAIVGIGAHAFSAGGNHPAKKYFVEQYPRSSQATGKVTWVGKDRPAIIISTQDHRTLFLIVNPETKFLKDGKNIKLSEIKKGNFVNVDYEIVYRDKNIAKSINVETDDILRHL